MSGLTDRLDGHTPELEVLRRANQTLQRELIKAKSRTTDLVDAVYRAANDAAVTMGPPAVPPKPKPSRRAGKSELAFIHSSDWQVGKVTSTYNSDIAATRLVDVFGDKIERITQIQREAHPVKQAHLLFGGDMVEGISIFPGQAFEVDSTLYEQVFRSAQIAEGMILRLLAIFDTVDVWEEYGNHGRIGRKGDSPAADNLDRIMYRIVQGRFADTKRVTWHPSTSWFQYVEVGNYTALLVHGDEVKSFGGNTPAFGILRKVNSWKAGVVPPFKDCYMGHWHTPMVLVTADGGRIFVSGSPESDNEYAREFVAATSTPSQRVNFVDPERGRVTAEYVVWLDD